MNKKVLLTALAGLVCCCACGQNDSTLVKSYSFLVLDKPAQLSTMRQFDQNYLSLYRLYATQLDKHLPKKLSLGIQMVSSILTIPLSHEEGHRSILTANDIGSISKPYFNSKGAAYVAGVKDIDLQALRDNNLPHYIRLHTAGLESDYMISLATERLLTFEEENYSIVGIEYLFRKVSTTWYYLSGMIKSLSPNLTEEKNELKRDIVGHDIYGAVRHLHRPEMNFYRYTDYEDLSSAERKFINRVGYRSLLLLLNPQFFGRQNFTLSSTTKANIGFGYSMTPFGDMMDNNLWIMHNADLKLLVQNRVYQNREKYFYGAGIKMFDYPIAKKYWLNVAAEFWTQPEGLDFTSTASDAGGLISGLVKYRLTGNSPGNRFITFDLGLQYKTFGFAPEEVILNEAFTLRFGFTYHVVSTTRSTEQSKKL